MNRRKLLQSIGIGTLGLTAIPVMAKRKSDRPTSGELNPDMLRKRVAAHDALVEQLHEDGVLKRSDPEQFAYEITVESGEKTDGVEWGQIRKSGTLTYVPTVNKEVENGLVRIYLLEETVVAVHTTRDGESRSYSASDSLESSLDCIPACPPGWYCVGSIGGSVGGALGGGVCLPLSDSIR